MGKEHSFEYILAMRPRQFSRSNAFRAISAVLIMLGLAIWQPAPLNNFLHGIFHTLFLPVERGVSGVAYGIRDIRVFLASIGDLNRENERLAEENARLLAENARLESLRKENEELRAFAELELHDSFDLLSGRVVARGEERGILLLDRGSVHGVQTGMPVLSSSGALVGTIRSVYPGSAEVMTLASSESALGGITSEYGTKGIVQGDRGLGVAFSMVPASEALVEGNRVVTTGTGEFMPPGLFVGTVSSVQETGDRLFREAVIAGSEHPERLRFLFVVRNEISTP